MDVSKDQVTAEQLSEALELFGRRLKRLEFSGLTNGDQVSAIVKSCPNLEVLNLERSYISGQSLATIASLRHLQFLNFSATDCTEEHFRELLSNPQNWNT